MFSQAYLAINKGGMNQIFSHDTMQSQHSTRNYSGSCITTIFIEI